MLVVTGVLCLLLSDFVRLRSPRHIRYVNPDYPVLALLIKCEAPATVHVHGFC